VNRSDWGKENSGKRTKTCPRHGDYEGFAASKCPTCKLEKPEMHGILQIDGKDYRVRIIVEPV